MQKLFEMRNSFYQEVREILDVQTENHFGFTCRSLLLLLTLKVRNTDDINRKML